MRNSFVQATRDTVKSRSYFLPLNPCCNQNIHQFLQFVALSFAQIILLVLGEQRQQLKRYQFAVVIVNYPHSATLAASAPAPSQLANTTRAFDQIPRFGMRTTK